MTSVGGETKIRFRESPNRIRKYGELIQLDTFVIFAADWTYSYDKQDKFMKTNVIKTHRIITLRGRL